MARNIIELNGVTKQFNGFTAIDDVSLQLDDKGLTALIGPNGAGKTTLYNVITGTLEPTSGTITFEGDNITSESSYRRAKKGIGRSYQITNIFEGLTVRENIRAPVIARSDQRRNLLGNVENKEEIAAETDEILELVGLRDIAGDECSTLAYGDKRRVEIGIVLATNPSLILLDEPTAGMNPTETENMVNLIETLNERPDIAIFMTEHDIDVIFSISSRIIVLSRGEIIADGDPEEIRQDGRVQTAYLGGEA